MDSRRAATLFGIPMKHLTLATLTLQNSALILIMHYSRVMPTVNGYRYYTSTAVFLNEVIKLAISLTMALYDLSQDMRTSSSATVLFKELIRRVFTGDSWRLAIPAMLYTLQNTLQYVAVSNLDAATFQVTYQLKILTTAIFSVTMLGHTLGLKKWASLLLLMVGVAIVQMSNGSNSALPTFKDLREANAGLHFPRTLQEMRDMGSSAAGQLVKRSATYEGIDKDFAMQHPPQLNASIGLATVLIACILSGLAGVYFEKVLKDSNHKTSLWVRNVQLSFYSLFPALFVGVIFKDGAELAKHGFFAGYNWVVWSAIFLQAIGGVLVALVVNYSDNIAKNFATSISIVISFLASVWFFNFEITSNYVLGTAVVLLATYLWTSDHSPPPSKTVIAEYEKTTIGYDQPYSDNKSTPKMGSRSNFKEALTTSRPSTPVNFERRGGGTFNINLSPSAPTMYSDDQHGHYMQHEQYVNDNVDAYIRNAGYEDDQTSYGTSRHLAKLLLAELDCLYGQQPRFRLKSMITRGSGKTVLFEIAICRMLRGRSHGTFKVIYMAPTKSLCSERTRDWKAKFEPLNLKCEEMTGDSDVTSLHHVQRADIIVTTPEKWDSMTRKWKDHEKLIRLVKLLLIDEVHILNKDRGAALEVVVSRMKSIASGTRFIALSATVPNSQDIATWLGRNDDNASIPATHKRFGEEFRPVELKRHVCGYQSSANAFGLDAMLTKKYSQKKPIMVFCFTRKSCTEAAKFLAEWWMSSAPRDRHWQAPVNQIRVEDKGLQSTVSAGVAVHHAGLGQADRGTVERAYLSGDLSVICCTSTLAVGVNLPCHMVIVKNTVTYEAGAVKECSDLEIMQMIGRAGRPQFDTSALAVIMTKMQQVKHYEQLLSGQERLESCLHLNLVEHLNAEIGLGMVPDLCAAKKWLAGTFLKVRIEDNPTHYTIAGDSPDRNLGARLEQICESAILHLDRLELIECTPTFKSTDYGEAMARYYINISTMEAILSLPRKPKISEILNVIAQAQEFKELRFRAGEKQLYKELNDMPEIRFPIKVDLSAAAHKVSLVIQSVLGGLSHVTDQPNHRVQHSIDQGLIFQHVHRLIRCIVDCENCGKDSIGIRNSLMLSRSLAARVWDDSPMVLQQIEQIGPVALRKLVSARITTMDEFTNTDPGRLELVLNKAPPFGMTLHCRAQTFPKLRVGLQVTGQPIVKTQEHVVVKLKIDFGFLNKKTPTQYRNKPVFVIVLLGTSDGEMMSFLRLRYAQEQPARRDKTSNAVNSAKKLERINPINTTAYLTSPTQLIECYVMCDELAGTMQQAVLKPNVPVSAFQSIKDNTADVSKDERFAGRTRIVDTTGNVETPQVNLSIDEWDDGGLKDDDFIHAEPKEDGYMDVDALEQPIFGQKTTGKARNKAYVTTVGEDPEEQRLENGRFACSHRCKDKTACKHQCCKEGLGKKSKPRARKTKDSEPSAPAAKSKAFSSTSTKAQSRLDLPIRRKTVGGPVEHLDLTQMASSRETRVPAAAMRLTSLHDSTTRPGEIPISGTTSTKIASSLPARPRFLPSLNPLGSIEEDIWAARSPLEHVSELYDNENDKPSSDDEEYLDRDEDMLDAALIGLEDSRSLQNSDGVVTNGQGLFAERQNVLDSETDYQEEDIGGPELFMTPHAQRTVVSSAAFEDAVPISVRTIDNEYSTSPGVVKRKRGEDMASAYFPAKKARTEDEAASYVYEKQTPVEEVDRENEEGEESKQKREVEELRAWLAAEFGDTVEMI
ncbi:P-loop containing nucleoside triphosphate hydrolase protein [Aureobasidium subglaciale]|nr:P-loop containing nucleoside triphosphate hydrolase protein [Aureobasidium subglaciale]